jgi:hypothetical protein
MDFGIFAMDNCSTKKELVGYAYAGYPWLVVSRVVLAG